MTATEQLARKRVATVIIAEAIGAVARVESVDEEAGTIAVRWGDGALLSTVTVTAPWPT
jgi:hypothetical protein